MQIVTQILAAVILGGVIGSVLNMIASRLPADGDPPVVGLPLRPATSEADAHALIPFAGAFADRGRYIDWPKLGIEAGAALIVGAALWRFGVGFEALRFVVFGAILLLILRIDWQNHLIFTITIVPGILIALAFSGLDSFGALLSALVASTLAAGLFLFLFTLALVIYRRRALGFGDVLLAALIGAMTGLESVGAAILLGIMLAGFGGLFLVAIRVRSRNDYIPYGAYLCLGAIIALML